MPSYYDIQQVCTKCGRQITGALKTYNNGEEFCTKCGGKTTSSCSFCGKEIQGNFVSDIEGIGSNPPENCPECGKAFPWKEKFRAGRSPGLGYYKEHGMPGSKPNGLKVGFLVALWILFFFLFFMGIFYSLDNNWAAAAFYGTPAAGLFYILITRKP